MAAQPPDRTPVAAAGQPLLSLGSLLLARLQARSGYEVRRPYVGMSGAADCPLVLYRRYRDGVPGTLDSHVGAWLGYTMERAVLALLDGEVLPGRELVAFDGVVRGHTDGEWHGGVLDVKSRTAEKVRQIVRRDDIPEKDYLQLQAYMHYGGWPEGRIIYVPRDYGQPIVWYARYSPDAAEVVDRRFGEVAAAVRSGAEPACRCGTCGKGAR